jgi:hypothetical protein
MKTISRTVLALLLVAVIGLAAGCAPKTPVEDGQITVMVKATMALSGYGAGYDAVPLRWNARQNTLQSSGTPVLHKSTVDQDDVLCWRSGSPLLAVQHWNLVTATSRDLTLLVPPLAMQSVSATSDFCARWYVPEENAFVSYGTLDRTVATITEQRLTHGSKAQALTAPVPSDLNGVVILYASGSITDGFVLLESPGAEKATTTSSLLWLLHMKDGVGSWVQCGGDTSPFNGFFLSGPDPSFARVGSLLYFMHSHTKIGCIDTAAVSPSVTLPEAVNTLLAGLYRDGPTPADVGGPLQARLASDNGMLIIAYPDTNQRPVYYAMDTMGRLLGSLRNDKTSMTSFDAAGKQGSSLPFQDMQQGILLPSIDLFESHF